MHLKLVCFNCHLLLLVAKHPPKSHIPRIFWGNLKISIFSANICKILCVWGCVCVRGRGGGVGGCVEEVCGCVCVCVCVTLSSLKRHCDVKWRGIKVLCWYKFKEKTHKYLLVPHHKNRRPFSENVGREGNHSISVDVLPKKNTLEIMSILLYRTLCFSYVLWIVATNLLHDYWFLRSTHNRRINCTIICTSIISSANFMSK